MTSEGGAADTREEIMRATYRSLCKHGYANLTMRTIADEFEKSKSLLHYHYDTKEDLLLAFLDRLIGWLPDRLAESETEDPTERLLEFIHRFVIGPDEESRHGFALALFELRLQAVHKEAFREKLAQHYAHNQGALEEIIADGIEAGRFREVDPERTAAWLYASLEGARMHQVVLGNLEATRTVGDGLADWVVPHLLVDGAAPGSDGDSRSDGDSSTE